MLSSRGRARFAARVEGSVVRRCRRAAGNKRRSFDCVPARPAKEAGRKFFAGAPLRMTPSSSCQMKGLLYPVQDKLASASIKKGRPEGLPAFPMLTDYWFGAI